MHYIGVLAFVLPIPVAYHWPTVLLSLFAAILASVVALYVVSRQKMGASRALSEVHGSHFTPSGCHAVQTRRASIKKLTVSLAPAQSAAPEDHTQFLITGFLKPATSAALELR
jgi:hypothetical protein